MSTRMRRAQTVRGARTASLLAAVTLFAAAETASASTVTVAASKMPKMSSCDGEFGQPLRDGFKKRSELAWVLMGVGSDGNSVLVGTRRQFAPSAVCAKVERRGARSVRIEIWADHEFGLCDVINGVKHCSDVLILPNPSPNPRAFVLPIDGPVKAQEFRGGRRSLADRPSKVNAAPSLFFRNFKEARKTSRFAVPNLVGLRVSDAQDVLAGIGGAPAQVSAGSGARRVTRQSYRPRGRTFTLRPLTESIELSTSRS